MPQGGRKVPFSAKQKKQQLQQKRDKKNAEHSTVVSSFSTQRHVDDVKVINQQPSSSGNHNPNRYHLVFKKENPEEVKKRRAETREPFEVLPECELEVSYEAVFAPDCNLEMPKRPPWDYACSKERLEAKEQKYFREYLDDLEQKFGDSLSHFEMNLETWRQLWRVIEFSDIILLVVDVRYAVYHLSPSLYDYVTNELKKDMILVLNKIDLVPAALVLAWQEYLKQRFPLINIMSFASYSGMVLKDGKKGKRIGKLHMAVEGTRRLLKICKDIVKDKVNLSVWKKKIDEEAALIGSKGESYSDSEESESDDEDKSKHKPKTIAVTNDTSYYNEERYKDGILTIGFVGHPNVGKSSFLNAVFGRKVVSVSRTPGHTKHYQTIMVTDNVRLCDCPGLVFPSLAPKPIQVLMGCYPISQLSEPYAAIQYLSQRVPVQSILNLKHPEFEPGDRKEDIKWSAYDICEAWAIKCGYRTAKAGRPDVYRAANSMLRMALDGRTLCLAFYPPDYTENKQLWLENPLLPEIIHLQAFRQKQSKPYDSDISVKLKSVEVAEKKNRNRGDAAESKKMPANKFDLLLDDADC